MLILFFTYLHTFYIFNIDNYCVVTQATQIFVAADGNVKFEMGEVPNTPHNQQTENNTAQAVEHIGTQNVIPMGQKNREIYR